MHQNLREFKGGDRRRDEQKDTQKNGHAHSYMRSSLHVSWRIYSNNNYNDTNKIIYNNKSMLYWK